MRGNLVVILFHVLQPLLVADLRIVGSADLIYHQEDRRLDRLEELLERERESEMDREVILVRSDFSHRENRPTGGD
nr:hypothetical protein [Rhizobium laguerreae]